MAGVHLASLRCSYSSFKTTCREVDSNHGQKEIPLVILNDLFVQAQEPQQASWMFLQNWKHDKATILAVDSDQERKKLKETTKLIREIAYIFCVRAGTRT
ncbi:hypothetical protein H5410_007262, partial [Solanum commersonii]